MEDSEWNNLINKNINEETGKRKEQNSKRQELAFNIEFKLLKIVSDRKVRIQKRVPQTRSAEVNSVGVELLVKTSNFNSK